MTVELRHLLFDKGRVGRTLELLKAGGVPEPAKDPDRALLHGHALNLYGDYQRALRIFEAVPPDAARDSERLWGQSGYHIRIGALHKAKRLLDRAFASNPPDWLLPHLHNHLATYYSQLGRFDDAAKTNETGLAAAEMSGNIIQLLVLTANQSIIQAIRGRPGDAVTVMERCVRQLLDRDSVLAAAHFLIVLAELYNDLGLPAQAKRCLQRAEPLAERSGSVGRMIFLKLAMAMQDGRDGRTARELQTYQEAEGLLTRLPDPMLTAQVQAARSMVLFRKGCLSDALAIADRLLADARSKGIAPQIMVSLGLRGRFLAGSGDPSAAAAAIEEGRALSRRLGVHQFAMTFSLLDAFARLRAGDRSRSLASLECALGAAAEHRLAASLLAEHEVLGELLPALGTGLRFDAFLARIAVSLGHPGLLRHLRRFAPPRGKLLFLGALQVHDAPRQSRQAIRLLRDADAAVRRVARAVLDGWDRHAGYRITTLGGLRVLLEDRMLPDEVWGRAAVRRIFLLLVANPGRWLAHDRIIELLWPEPDPAAARRVLASRLSELRRIIEPWHAPGKPYGLIRSRPGACGLFGGERVWIDAESFAELARRAEDARNRRCFREARQAYRQALELYAGDFLEEHPYEEWLAPRRAELRNLYFRATVRYAALELDSGNPAESRRALEEALYRDLGCGECLRLLLEVLRRLKLPTLAREWGARHADYLRREIGTEPDPEIERLIAGLE